MLKEAVVSKKNGRERKKKWEKPAKTVFAVPSTTVRAGPYCGTGSTASGTTPE